MTNYFDAMVVNEKLLRLSVAATIFFAMAMLELLIPQREQTLGRSKRWPGNLGIMVLDTLFVRVIFPVTAVAVATYATDFGFRLFNFLKLSPVFAIVLSVVLLDLIIYLQHLVFHFVPVLWQLHRMHHTDIEFDVTTALRFHPLEISLSMLIKIFAIFRQQLATCRSRLRTPASRVK